MVECALDGAELRRRGAVAARGVVSVADVTEAADRSRAVMLVGLGLHERGDAFDEGLDLAQRNQRVCDVAGHSRR